MEFDLSFDYSEFAWLLDIIQNNFLDDYAFELSRKIDKKLQELSSEELAQIIVAKYKNSGDPVYDFFFASDRGLAGSYLIDALWVKDPAGNYIVSPNLRCDYAIGMIADDYGQRLDNYDCAKLNHYIHRTIADLALDGHPATVRSIIYAIEHTDDAYDRFGGMAENLTEEEIAKMIRIMIRGEYSDCLDILLMLVSPSIGGTLTRPQLVDKTRAAIQQLNDEDIFGLLQAQDSEVGFSLAMALIDDATVQRFVDLMLNKL